MSKTETTSDKLLPRFAIVNTTDAHDKKTEIKRKETEILLKLKHRLLNKRREIINRLPLTKDDLAEIESIDFQLGIKFMTTSEKLLPTSDEIIDAHNHNVIRHIYLETIKKLLKQDNIDDAYKALDMYAAKVNTRILRKPDPKDVELVRHVMEEGWYFAGIRPLPFEKARFDSLQEKYKLAEAAFNRIVGNP